MGRKEAAGMVVRLVGEQLVDSVDGWCQGGDYTLGQGVLCFSGSSSVPAGTLFLTLDVSLSSFTLFTAVARNAGDTMSVDVE